MTIEELDYPTQSIRLKQQESPNPHQFKQEWSPERERCKSPFHINCIPDCTRLFDTDTKRSTKHSEKKEKMFQDKLCDIQRMLLKISINQNPLELAPNQKLVLKNVIVG